MSVEAAIELLESGKDDEALATLLAAWRALRDPALANAIDAVGARIDGKRERPTGKTIKQKDVAWHEVADANEPADTGILLATLGDVVKGEILEGRIEALAKRAADPRIAMRLAELIVQMPVVGATGVDAMKLALDEIERIGDVRTIPLLQERLVSPRAGTSNYAASDYVHERLNVSIGRVQQHAKPAVVLDGLARIHELVAPDTTHAASETELYAAVYANPDDDGPRLVLADVLQHRGDRRGEFIALQMKSDWSREAQSRAGELVRSYGREWLGVIEPAVKKSGMKYERGFLAKCDVQVPHEADVVLAAREWATLVDVNFAGWNELANHFATRMPALRKARGLRRMFESHPTLDEVSLGQFTHEDLDKLVRVDAPALRVLWLETVYPNEQELWPFWKTRTGKQLDHFGIRVLRPLDWMIDVRPRVRLLVVESLTWRYRFEGDELAVTYSWPHIPPSAWTDLAEILEALPPDIVKRVKLPEQAGPTNRVAAAVKRFA